MKKMLGCLEVWQNKKLFKTVFYFVFILSLDDFIIKYIAQKWKAVIRSMAIIGFNNFI